MKYKKILVIALSLMFLSSFSMPSWAVSAYSYSELSTTPDFLKTDKNIPNAPQSPSVGAIKTTATLFIASMMVVGVHQFYSWLTGGISYNEVDAHLDKEDLLRMLEDIVGDAKNDRDFYAKLHMFIEEVKEEYEHNKEFKDSFDAFKDRLQNAEIMSVYDLFLEQAIILHGLGKYKLAMFFFKKIYSYNKEKVSKKIPNSFDRARFYFYMGLTLCRLQKYELALICFSNINDGSIYEDYDPYCYVSNNLMYNQVFCPAVC